MSNSELGAQKASLEFSHSGSVETPQHQPKKKKEKKNGKKMCDSLPKISSGIDSVSLSGSDFYVEPDTHLPGGAEGHMPTIVTVSEAQEDGVDLDAVMEDCGECFCGLLSALFECFCCIFELLGSFVEEISDE